MDPQEDEGIPATTLREIAMLKKLNHPNIVKLRDVHIFLEEPKIYLIFDYYKRDLRTYLKEMPDPETKSLSFF